MVSPCLPPIPFLSPLLILLNSVPDLLDSCPLALFLLHIFADRLPPPALVLGFLLCLSLRSSVGLQIIPAALCP